MIRFSTQDTATSHPGYTPYTRARRWWSDVEAEERPPSVPVFVTQKAYVRINKHAGSDLDNEVGGWLIGKQRNDHHTGQTYIVVEAVLPAMHTRHGGAFLTFTQDGQVAMYKLMEDHYPGKELVGWYHTHPKMGIFLSNYDVWLHKYFFKNPWQVALVVEPHSNVAGFFAWDTEGQLDSRYYYGFHEINNGRARSVVRWRNMSSRPLSEVEGDR